MIRACRLISAALALLLTSSSVTNAAHTDGSSLGSKAVADAPIEVPDGFVLQHLEATDGLIARPKAWHYLSHGDPAGWTYIISAEDAATGTYETGLRIQVLVGVHKGTGKTPQEFAQGFLEGKRDGATFISDCQPTEQGMFMRQCLEVIENLTLNGTTKRYHVSYSAFWGKTMDMVIVTTFGTPAERWEEFKNDAAVMANFQLIGPNFGKNLKPAPSSGTP